MNGHPLPNNVAAVVPCYNAGERLGYVLEILRPLVQSIILVDDGSTDGGPEGAQERCDQIIRFDQNRGKGHALIAGYRKALEDPAITCVASLDADGQHDPAELPNLYQTFSNENAGLVIGSRQFSGGHVPLRSRLGNEVTVAVMGALTGHRLPDTQSGYRLLSRALLERALDELQGGRYETEMEILLFAFSEGFKVCPCPIQTIYETGNPSSHFRKIGDSLRIYRALWRCRKRN